MKYITSAFLTFTFFIQCFAQNINFTLASPQPEINEVYSGSILSGDLDNDGDIDLIQSGIGLNLEGTIAQASVFLNDGNGNFSIEEQNFNNFFNTEQIWMGDLDNDNDLDIIISAINRTEFYRNDGQAQFVHDDTAPFQASDFSSFIIGDVDGDGDNDVLQFGRENTSTPFAVLYFNDGSGTFSAAQNSDFTPIFLPTNEFIDLEGDGDKDIISFGQNDNDEAQINIYENDGLGNYSIFSSSNIAPHFAEGLSVGDIDNDGDDDVLISGTNEASIPKTILYLNNGNGQFSESMNTTFPDIFASGNNFSDLDNDGDLDVLLIGSMDGGLPNIFSIVFENLGNNNYVATDSLGGEYIAKNTIADFNGDGKKDIIIQGFVDDTNIYWNETIFSSINDYSNTLISLYPNPTNGQFQIEWEEEAFNKIEILDLNGKLIFSETIIEQGMYPVEFIAPSGIYILKMSGENNILTKKILLTK